MVRFRSLRKAPDLGSDLADIRFFFIFEPYTLLWTMKSSLERRRELSYKLLANPRTKKEGCDSQGTRHTLSSSVTALCPTIKPYDWQIDPAEALTLGLDATVIAGTCSGKTLPWVMPLLLDENHNKICPVISSLNELEADHVQRRRTLLKQRILPLRFHA